VRYCNEITYRKKVRFTYLKNSQMSCGCVEDILLCAVESRFTSQSLVFFTVHSHELITAKIPKFYPAHFDLLIISGLKFSSCNFFQRVPDTVLSRGFPSTGGCTVCTYILAWYL
jgi:hypothetical protein